MAATILSYLPVNSLALLIPLSLAISAALAFTYHVFQTFFGPLSNIPGPRLRAFSIIPYLKALWTGDDAASVLMLHEKYGPVVRLAPDLIAFIGSGQILKTIYASKLQGNPLFGKDFLFYEKPFNQIPGPFGSDNATNSRMRKSMAPAFSDSGLKHYESRFKHWCNALVDRLAVHARDSEPADMVKLFNLTTFDIMGDMLLSGPLHLLEKGDYSPFVRLIFTFLRHVTRFKTVRYYSRTLATQTHSILLRIPAICRTVENHHRFITSRVQERLTKIPEQPDIWSLVTAEVGTASLITEEERYSIASELMIAGTETTATALSGCLYHLLQNPTWLAALTHDLRSQYESSEQMTMNSLQANKLLDAILKESMRMYPPVPIGIPRVVPPGGTQVGNFYIPGGTRVTVYQLATYREPSFWREPDKFHPERWLGDEKFKDDHLEAFEPFSLGLRGCSGKNFAWHEMRLILAITLFKFDFELNANSSRNWLDQKVFLVWEKPPLMVNVKESEV